MASTTRYTYNITSQNNDLDRNNSYYTYNNYNNYDNINNNNLYTQNQNQNNSILNQTTPLIYNEDNNSNLNNITYNVNRFNRLHSRLDEINEKINRDKDEKENYIHNKITTTEMILDNNNEIRARKIKEIKTSIRGLSALFEQIKNFSKESNSQSNEILENFENKFNMRLKQEQDKRINLEKRLKGVIDSKFKDMKIKIMDCSNERLDDLENLKNKMDEILPQMKMKVDESKKIRRLKDDEIKEKN
jgi:tetrahydromethanopterin S-methyltransferase subunit G